MARDDSRELIVLARRDGRCFKEERMMLQLKIPQQANLVQKHNPGSNRAQSSEGSRTQRGSGVGRGRTADGGAASRRLPSAGPASKSTPSSSSAGPSGKVPKRPQSAGGGGMGMRRPKDWLEDPLIKFKDKLDRCVESSCDLDHAEAPFFRTALWEASWKNNQEIVRLLLDRKASVCKADYQGRTPLHEAAFYGHIQLCEFLLDRGHPMDCIDRGGQTPLFRAVDGGRQTLAALLVERKAQVSLIDTDNVTVQHVAAFRGMPQLSEWLLYQGAFKNRLAMDDVPLASLVPSPHAAVTDQPQKVGDTSEQAHRDSRNGAIVAQKPPLPQSNARGKVGGGPRSSRTSSHP